MLQIRKSEDRGHAQHGWLESRHSFSFADYYDPENLGFRALRVLNEDRVQPGAGFAEHPHRDMEILSIVLSGSLAHRDSMGNGSVLSAGDVQSMTAGSGVRHSEMNPSLEEPVHFLQIWIHPEQNGLEPGYQERHFDRQDKAGRLALIASGKSENGVLTIRQDVDVYATVLEPGQELRHGLDAERHVWVQVVEGELEVNGQTLSAGDAAAVSEESEITLVANAPSEALLFDLA
ncbi:MAG: pirin family protein [Acidobacteriota bacterium]